MLLVAARQFRDPVPVDILMEADDFAPHNGPRTALGKERQTQARQHAEAEGKDQMSQAVTRDEHVALL